MRAQKAMLALLAAAGVWSWDMQCEAASKAAVRICGRHLSELMSRVCKAYNSPAWDNPMANEPPAGVVRRRRDLGIATECCIYGCTWEQLTKYCQEPSKTSSESSLDTLETHLIADRSAETEAAEAQPPLVVGGTGEDLVRNAARAAPLVGTVSPLFTWGRTLHADLQATDLDRYAYVGVVPRP